MRGQKLILALMCLSQLALGAGGLAAARYFSRPRFHYEVRQDLSVYFTNSDRVIEDLRNALEARQAHITITYSSGSDNSQDLAPLVKELMDFALSDTGEPTQGDYIYYQYGGYDLTYRSFRRGEGYSYELTITPDYYSTADQEALVDEQVKAVLKALDLPADASDLEKTRGVYDFVKTHVSYDLVHEKNPHHKLKATAYSALVHKQAVCQGIAVLTYRLLREEGVEARIISGTTDSGERHAWNTVTIDEQELQLDLSWDIQTGTEDCFLKASLPGHYPEPDPRSSP